MGSYDWRACSRLALEKGEPLVPQFDNPIQPPGQYHGNFYARCPNYVLYVMYEATGTLTRFLK